MPFPNETMSTFLCCLTLLLNFCSYISPLLATITTTPYENKNTTDKLALLAFKTSIIRDPNNAMSSWNDSLHHCSWHGVSCSRHNGRVTALMLGHMNLMGSIPPQIGNLSLLRLIDLENNKFQGSIPQEIGRLFRLWFLHLGSNSLSGQIPASLTNCLNLQVVHLSNNLLTGKIPKELGTSLRLMYDLVLSNNSLTGELNYLSNCSSLQRIDLSLNELFGEISRDIGNLFQLIYFLLDGNQFIGEIPRSISNCSELFTLTLSHNKLSGEIPPSICNVSRLVLLDFSNNRLVSAIPECVGLFSIHLSFLNLAMNRLYGTIPQTFPDGNSLTTIDFNGNNLVGPIPRALANCELLEVLNLGNNKLNGTFPYWLETLHILEVLVLRSNRLHGSIGNSNVRNPFTRLRIIDLSHNSFTGPLPENYLENFEAMMTISEKNLSLQYMGEGYYENSITMTTKGLEIHFERILITLTIIDFSSNGFLGEIPRVVGKLVSLRGLNFSHNNLKGGIPSSLSNLSDLESLDLSRNQLVGEIPSQLTSLTFLQVLNLSYNHLVGPIPRAKQFGTFTGDSYVGNSGLYGFPPLSNTCNKIDDDVPEQEKDENSNFASEFDWRVVVSGYGCGLIFGLVMGCVMFLTRKPKWFVRIVEEEILKKVKKSANRPHKHRRRRN